MVARGEGLKPTTDRLCIEIEKLLPNIVCSILWLDRDGCLHPLSGPSLPEEYSAAIDGAAIGPMAGSCGSAAYWRAPVAVTDIETDTRWVDFKENSAQPEAQSMLVEPDLRWRRPSPGHLRLLFPREPGADRGGTDNSRHLRPPVRHCPRTP